jgi:hypothetical protein
MIPDWWVSLLIALAAFRTFRLIGYDTILDPVRNKVIKREQAHDPEGKYRRELDIFMHCPWCLGFWITAAWWLSWLAWPHFTTVVAVPWALSAFVGLVAKNLDE